MRKGVYYHAGSASSVFCPYIRENPWMDLTSISRNLLQSLDLWYMGKKQTFWKFHLASEFGVEKIVV
jgi:hypothetical protein